MAHECFNCGSECYCHGHIDDSIVSLTPENCDGCGCIEEQESSRSMEDDFFDDELNYQGVVTASDVCRECGCHTYMACYHPEHDTCWWAEKATTDQAGDFVGPLCSHCAMKLENVERPWKEQTS